MTPARLLLITSFAVRLLAENGIAPNDPFDGYHGAIEHQLSGMLETQQAQLREVREAALPERNISPDESNQSELKTLTAGFWGRREPKFAAALDRLHRLLPTIDSVLDDEGVPKQLTGVVLVESGAKPSAISPRQARGLWQLIPGTARRYGLTVSTEKDERVDVESSTRAAAHYLRDLYSRFGDWSLALAAYNTGQDTVERALKKSRMSTFWQLSSAGLLPSETRSYVPAVLAAMRLLGPTQAMVQASGNVRPDHWVYASTGVFD